MRIDTRAGSKGLIQPLRALRVPVEEALLPAGDIEIMGNGPEGRPILIGVEYKTVEDLCQCVRNGRFAEQLRKMRESFEVNWLLIQGRMAGFDTDGISVKRGKWFHLPGKVSYQEIAAWSLSMAQCGGALLWRTETQEESIHWLRSLEMWWSKDYDQHRSHLDWYTPPVTSNPFAGPPSLVRRWANELPRVGNILSEGIASHFHSAKRMATATREDWTKIDGVGKKMAESIVRAIEEEV